MNTRTRSSAAVVLALVTASVALGVNLQACELVTDFDRSLIPDASEPEDGSEGDVVTPPFDGAVPDANVLPTDSGSDAGDATITDAATDASDAEPVDASDAGDAADAADGGDGGDADAS